MVPEGCMAADTNGMVSVVSAGKRAKNGMLQGLGYREVLHTMVSTAFGEQSASDGYTRYHRARPSPMNRPIGDALL